jgi:hypothetical protein
MKPNTQPTPAQQESVESFARELALILRRIKKQSSNTQKAGRNPSSGDSTSS